MNTRQNEPLTAPECLRKESYDVIRSRMLYGSPEGVDDVNHSESFTKYLHDFVDLRPDAMFFTANSALPLADSVRGAYEELGQCPPRLFAIRANSELSLSFDENAGMFSSSKRQVNNEINRLKKMASGKEAVVIDQYVETGGTLRLAAYMLAKAGVRVVADTPNARWYEEARISDIDIHGVTSRHADFMRSVGREAIRTA